MDNLLFGSVIVKEFFNNRQEVWTKYGRNQLFPHVILQCCHKPNVIVSRRIRTWAVEAKAIRFKCQVFSYWSLRMWGSYIIYL